MSSTIGSTCSISTRDGELWAEDSFEVFIDPERDRGSRMAGGDRQFVVNARGTQLDTDGTGAAWDGEWRAGRQTDRDRLRG